MGAILPLKVRFSSSWFEVVRDERTEGETDASTLWFSFAENHRGSREDLGGA